VVREPKEGTAPSTKPPVRIFLGTEPRQARAERTFIWSVERVRDPSRRYEIHLMKDIAGITRTRWATGFTSYRYAIPTWAGGHGRAIYNDVDQIYLADPAEMFDMDMQDKAIAAVEEREYAVMLIDCEKMLPFWNLDAVKDGKGHNHFKDAVVKNEMWTRLPGEWNSRDGEFPVEQSKLLHFTTLYTQPWKPFPEEYFYREGPGAETWKTLEREADAAEFTPVVGAP
jgi:hypothetical protein